MVSKNLYMFLKLKEKAKTYRAIQKRYEIQCIPDLLQQIKIIALDIDLLRSKVHYKNLSFNQRAFLRIINTVREREIIYKNSGFQRYHLKLLKDFRTKLDDNLK